VHGAMAITARLEFRQSQQLVMTPQLQQAIRLLQYSNLELNAFIESELERNPLLEREDEDGARAETLTDFEAPVEDGPTSHSGEREDWLDLTRSDLSAASNLDADVASVYPDATAADVCFSVADAGWASIRPSGSTGREEDANLEAFVAAPVSLKDHLLGQLPLAISDSADRFIGQFLIDLVDDAGYLTGDLQALADRLGTTTAEIERVVIRLQTLDPAGVFARSLRECLELQLKDLNRFDPQIAKLLDHLELLAARNLPALRKAVGVNADELAEMIAEIKRLDPKPGLKFGSTHVQPVVPDIIVRSAVDGGWHVELNSETLPRVLVNRAYYARISRCASSRGEKSYLLGCLQTANWLVRSLDQRARTILRVSEEIVRQQDGFFAQGVRYLRPLNLKAVAEAVGMHESTISRVTSNKYMATPRGIFELKYFFTSAIPAAGEGEAHSSEAVRHRIRQMIDHESSHLILSDDMIVEKLKSEGIDIARRTVAKYRESMRIPSSVQRRRDKRLCNGGVRSLA
jgi:RNA polymerase sigma-54 factor